MGSSNDERIFTSKVLEIIDTSSIYIALVHHPVYNKSGLVVTTAVTNLDLHDISRTARTFGLGGYYVVNPMPAQRALAGRILRHWTEGHGAAYNPNRKDALSVMRVVGTLDEALAEVEARHGTRPVTIATTARRMPGAVGYRAGREMLAGGAPVVLLFGTGWGMTGEFIEAADRVLEPIEAGGAAGAGDAGGFNHLPVRAAVAIILDRLLSDRA